jgi:regulator of protease activity HflC (stomatin/prohibitin superfamily)
VILSHTKDGIKNEAIFVTFNEYFQDRKAVEQCFKEAVQSWWNQTASVHATLDQFHLGRIQIPNTVAKKQLESKISKERNSREDFLQKTQLEQETTNVEVNQINLETNKIMRTATANANLIVANAQAEAVQIKSNADIYGTTLLFKNARIELQEEEI